MAMAVRNSYILIIHLILEQKQTQFIHDRMILRKTAECFVIFIED